ncbi:MAG TPA: tetratricopeptide repeat protein [Candidatus Nitrosotenuis sp.]|nr:tetratricopeptide repeat protein [Candidatus Nitrosotenuis sp.]
MSKSIAKSLSLTALALLAASVLAANSPTPAELVEDGHWKRARAALEPLAQRSPNDAQTLYLLGRVKFVYRDYAGALSLAERAAAIDPKNAEYRWLIASAVGEMADDAGPFKAMGLARRFKREAEQVIVLDPKHIDSRWGLMEFHKRAPGIVGGDDKKAYVYLEEIKKLNPVRGQFAEYRMRQLEKKQVSPEPYYLKAYELEPNNYDVLRNLARFYSSDQQKKYDLAEKYARAMLKLKPQRTAGYTLLAFLYAMQKNWKELEGVIAESEKNIPDSFITHFQAAATLGNSGADNERAERYFKKYLSIEPEPGHPTHADAHFLLGRLYETKMNRREDAVREYQEALRLNKDHEEAKKALKRLK